MDVTPSSPPSCPACGALRLAEDRYCEHCGAPLGATEAPVARPPWTDLEATAVRASGAVEEGVGCLACGAPEEAIGADGYCTHCGLLRRGRPEHREVDVVVAAGVTDQGRIHHRNEDALFLEAAGDRGVAAVVCDGISSSSSPHLAARSAALAAGASLAGALRGGATLVAATETAASLAQRAVLEVVAHSGSARDVPACTLVSAVYRDGEVVVGWLGDSRAYWICGPDSHRLTVDDSWAEEEIEAGRLSFSEAQADPRAHAITRWVGADAPDDPAQVATLRPAAPGRVVLCSDGLWNYVPEAVELAQLIDALPAAAPPIEVARSLLDTALAAGGRDNVTVAVIDVQPQRRKAI